MAVRIASEPIWLATNEYVVPKPIDEKMSILVKSFFLGMGLLCSSYYFGPFIPAQIALCAAVLMAARHIVAIFLVYKSYKVGQSFSIFNPSLMMAHKAQQIEQMTDSGFLIYERFIVYDHVRYSAVVIMHKTNMHNQKWFLHALGAGWEWENLLGYYGRKNYQHQCNTILINGPGVSLSEGWPAKNQILGAVKAGLYFLEYIAKATHIILHGSCLGSVIISQAMLEHTYAIKEKRDVRYLVISHVAFSKVSSFIESLKGKIYSPLILFSGVEFDGVAAAKSLSERGIKQIVIQHTSPNNSGTDGLVKDRVSLAAHLRRENLPDKVYLESEELVHNQSIPPDLEGALFHEVQSFLGKRSCHVVYAPHHPRYEQAKKYFEKHLKTGVDVSRVHAKAGARSPVDTSVSHYLLTKDSKPGRYKKYVPYSVPGLEPCVLLTDPKAIHALQQVHRFSLYFFSKSAFFTAVSSYSGESNLLTAPEQMHHKLVQTLSPYMNPSSVKAMRQPLTVLANEWVESCQAGSVTISPLIYDFVLKALVNIFLRSEKEAALYAEILGDLLQEAPLPHSYTNALLLELDCLLLPFEPGSWLDELQHKRDSDGQPTFENAEILSIGKMVLFSGYETLASLLHYLIFSLGKDLETQQQLREEIQTYPSIDEFIDHSRLLSQVIQEGLRLNPSVGLISRKADVDLIIAGKYFVPQGWHISGLPLWANRDSKRWGQDAKEFRPEHCREAQPPFVFGGGFHLCFGRLFTLSSAKIMLATILSRFSWRTENPECLHQIENVLLKLSDNLTISLVHSSTA